MTSCSFFSQKILLAHGLGAQHKHIPVQTFDCFIFSFADVVEALSSYDHYACESNNAVTSLRFSDSSNGIRSSTASIGTEQQQQHQHKQHHELANATSRTDSSRNASKVGR